MRELLTGKRCPDPGEMVVTVPHRMILEEELASERSIATQRYWRSAIQLFITQGAYRRSRSGAIACQQGKRGFFCDGIVLLRVVAVYGVNAIPGYACDWLASSEQLRELDLDRVHGGNVIHHDSDLSPILGNARLPLCFGKGLCKGSECVCAGLHAGGEGFGSIVHVLYLSSGI
jgi:hypothetical protein